MAILNLLETSESLMSDQRVRLTLLGLLIGALCAVSPCRAALAQTTIRIGGNGSGLGTIKLLAQAYQREHPTTSVVVLGNLGSTGGIAAVQEGALDIAISARPLKTDEQTGGARAEEYARTPFIFAIHGKLHKTGMTEYEFIGILRQDVPKWPDGTRIRIVLRPEQDTDTAILRQISSEMNRALQGAYARPGMVLAVTDSDSLNAIARMQGSLGTASLSQIMTDKPSVQILSYNGVEPTLRNLGNGSYPLVKRYYLVTTAKSPQAARHFAQFLRSPRAREILKRTGNLPFDAKERRL